MKRITLLFAILFSTLCINSLSVEAQSVPIRSLGERSSSVAEGITWGIPFQKGVIKATQTFQLTDPSGTVLPLESWPLAYWPDGSLKWVGFATTSTADESGYTLTAMPIVKSKKKTTEQPTLLAENTAQGIQIATGNFSCLIPNSGTQIIQDLSIDQKIIASEGHLVCILEKDQSTATSRTISQNTLTSRVEKVSIQHNSDVRAVIKIEGTHYVASGQQSALPFSIYLYFYKDLPSIKMVHSFVYDSDGNNEAIKGLGVQFTLPFREELHNRHVRLAGEGKDGSGFWVQPVRLLPGYRPSAGQVIVDTYSDHLDGKRMPNLADYPENTQTAITSCPIWGDMRLLQTHPNGFSIDKRTSDSSSWLHVTDGERSLGGALLGDVSGSMYIGIKYFWQKYPSAIEINQADKESGTLTAWLWTPESPAMDLRSYDTLAHGLSINYEDWKPGWNSPYGIANTSELNIRLFTDIPSNDDLWAVTQATQEPLQFVSTPEYYYSQKILGGYWGLPDNTNPVTSAIENELNRTISYLQGQKEQRYWYGFWNYGDIMHNYDFGRHDWRYDVGGWAWTNTELMPDLFLWVSFLRTGRADIWDMAEAMVRHTSEVDVHHIGRFAPLGTRHNVTHWGDGCKQPRISHSGLKRVYYYLTADDRIGDLMHEQLTADATYDYVKRNDTRSPVSGTYISHGFGTDWAAYAVNWMTEWERTGNTYWRDRILNGMKDMMALGQNGSFTTGLYDPETGRYMKLIKEAEPVATQLAAGMPQGGPQAQGQPGQAQQGQAQRQMPQNFMATNNNAPKSDYAPASSLKKKKTAAATTGNRGGNRGVGYFDMIFGAPEFMCELSTMIDYPEFWEAWTAACASLSTTSGNNMTGPRMAAYTAHVTQDQEMGERAWKNLLDNAVGTPNYNTHVPGETVVSKRLINPVEDPIFLGQSAGWQLHNPSTMQWALNALEVMELAKEYCPAETPQIYLNTIKY